VGGGRGGAWRRVWWLRQKNVERSAIIVQFRAYVAFPFEELPFLFKLKTKTKYIYSWPTAADSVKVKDIASGG
jgi:hypothetical protein